MYNVYIYIYNKHSNITIYSLQGNNKNNIIP